MRPKNLPIILCASIALAIAPARAQISNDPSESFLSAFSAFQKAEKVESTGNALAALAAYKDAARTLEQISSRWPQWNPAIVEFRKKRTADAILKVQEKMARNGGNAVGGGNAGASIPLIENDAITAGGGAGTHDFSGGIEPELPTSLIPAEPLPEPAPSIAPRATSRNSSGGGSRNPIQDIQDEMDRLHRELDGTRTELEKIRKEKEDFEHRYAESQSANQKAEQQMQILKQRSDVSEEALLKAISEGKKESDLVKKLQADASKARKELKDAQIEREAAEEVRRQLADRLSGAQKRISALTTERDAATKLSSEASTRIAEARKQMELAIKERELLNERLTKMTAERDDALAQVAKMKESQKQVDKLISENTELMAKLEAAEKQITQFKADGIEKDKMITDLKNEVGTVKQQLADTQKQSQEYQVQMGELKTKLESTAQQLAQAKTDSATGASEKKKMVEENELLRGIVLRQMKEQARRDQTRKLVLDQMAKLEGKSKDLLSQIDYLGQPVVKLSEKERALFKKAQVEISDSEISISATKSSGDSSADPAAAEAAAPTEGASALAAADNASSPATLTPASVPDSQAPVEKAAELPTKNIAAVPADIGTPTPQGAMPAELLPLVKEGKTGSTSRQVIRLGCLSISERIVHLSVTWHRSVC